MVTSSGLQPTAKGLSCPISSLRMTVLLFCKATISESTRIMEILSLYEQSSGLPALVGCGKRAVFSEIKERVVKRLQVGVYLLGSKPSDSGRGQKLLQPVPPLGGRLETRRCVLSAFRNAETVSHILWQCPLAQNTWATIRGPFHKMKNEMDNFAQLLTSIFSLFIAKSSDGMGYDLMSNLECTEPVHL
uniref:Reverse transcriptase zinc-binding domain-containing protein n=1 Tax=Fagus sylvatica TaxID=28930 RepID=A0A2N9FQ01_FAGSY